jgi:hypothetical protein
MSSLTPEEIRPVLNRAIAMTNPTILIVNWLSGWGILACILIGAFRGKLVVAFLLIVSILLVRWPIVWLARRAAWKRFEKSFVEDGETEDV